MQAHIGADSLKKPHHIITLQFSEVVKDHAKYQKYLSDHVVYKLKCLLAYTYMY